MANKYVSPGVYVRDVDYSIYTTPKNYKRMKKIARIYDNIEIPVIITATQKGPNNPIYLSNSDDFDKIFGKL
jgi:hypothetical protein